MGGGVSNAAVPLSGRSRRLQSNEDVCIQDDRGAAQPERTAAADSAGERVAFDPVADRGGQGAAEPAPTALQSRPIPTIYKHLIPHLGSVYKPPAGPARNVWTRMRRIELTTRMRERRQRGQRPHGRRRSLGLSAGHPPAAIAPENSLCLPKDCRMPASSLLPQIRHGGEWSSVARPRPAASIPHRRRGMNALPPQFTACEFNQNTRTRIHGREHPAPQAGAVRAGLRLDFPRQRAPCRRRSDARAACAAGRCAAPASSLRRRAFAGRPVSRCARPSHRREARGSARMLLEEASAWRPWDAAFVGAEVRRGCGLWRPGLSGRSGPVAARPLRP